MELLRIIAGHRHRIAGFGIGACVVGLMGAVALGPFIGQKEQEGGVDQTPPPVIEAPRCPEGDVGPNCYRMPDGAVVCDETKEASI